MGPVRPYFVEIYIKNQLQALVPVGFQVKSKKDNAQPKFSKWLLITKKQKLQNNVTAQFANKIFYYLVQGHAQQRTNKGK